MSFFNFSTFSQLCRTDTTEELKIKQQTMGENVKLISDCFALFQELAPYIEKPTLNIQESLRTAEEVNLLSEEIRELQPSEPRDCWSPLEHSRFVSGLLKFGPKTPDIQRIVQTRSCKEVASHMEKYLLKIQKAMERPAFVRPSNIPIEFMEEFVLFLEQHDVVVENTKQITEKEDKNIRVGNFGKECYGYDSVVVIPCEINFDLFQAKEAIAEVIKENQHGAVIFKRLISLGDSYDFLLQKAAETAECYTTNIMICVAAEFFGITSLGV